MTAPARRRPEHVPHGSVWSRSNILGTAAIVACALATMATSPNYVTHPRNYPSWELSEPTEKQHAGMRLKAWVSKSGKTGLGVTLAAASCRPARARVAVIKATLLIEGAPGPINAAPPAPKLLDRTDVVQLYLAFPFDNEALWNQGRRSGTLHMRLRIDDKAISWALPANHVLRSFHKEVKGLWYNKSKDQVSKGRAEQRVECPSADGILQMRDDKK